MKTIKKFQIVDFFYDNRKLDVDGIVKFLNKHLEVFCDGVKSKKLQNVMKQDILDFKEFAKDAKVSDIFTLHFSKYDPSIDDIICI